MIDDMRGLYPSALSAYKAGRAKGYEESMKLTRLLASSVARKYETEGSDEMARAAAEIADIIFDLQARIE